MTAHTQWNGQPCTATRVTAVVADSGQFPGYWARDLVGTVRKAVRVEYGGETFYLDDEDSSGWHKVTHGGGPGSAHRSLEVEPGSAAPRFEPDVATSTPGMNEPGPPRMNRAQRREAAREMKRRR